MIEIFKAENINILRYLTEKLPEFIDTDVDLAIQQILYQWAKDEKNFNLTVCFEDEKLKAFVLGWIEPLRTYAWVEYAYGDPTLDKVQRKETLDRFCDWAKDKGKNEIRFMTKRMSAKAWKRLYDAEEIALVLRKEI